MLQAHCEWVTGPTASLLYSYIVLIWMDGYADHPVGLDWSDSRLTQGAIRIHTMQARGR